jgi:hypothetical protein
VVVGLGAALVGTFLPWVRSGQRRRSSYGLLSLIDRLGFAPGGVAAGAIKAWVVVPILVAATIAALVAGRPAIAGMAAVLTGAYVAALALAVSSAPLPIESGVPIAAVGGCAALLGGAALTTTTLLLRRGVS